MNRPDTQAMFAAFTAALAEATTLEQIEAVRQAHTGKKSEIKLALRGLGAVPAEDRPAVAKEVNDVAQTMERALSEASAAIEARALAARLSEEWVDLSLPGLAPPRGARHPVISVEEDCLAVLRQLGFVRVDGPEVEHPYYNFDALNIPPHHPARDMQDTFWVDGGYLLRSHTTTVQARVLESRPPLPIRVASAGRVYRNEAVDATHLAMFHQLEGLWIDRGLTFAHLKGLLTTIAQSLYGRRPVRFKPKFYPYTEPSVGVDLQCGVCEGEGEVSGAPCEACHGAGWVTILGAGMVHPKVFREFGYDPNEVSGIAFGLGTTRMASQRVGVSKVALLYGQDLRVHTRLHRSGV
ncbi:MAG: phenylalanine--tRNA ligase subunit alpha [Deltaproteobacteria bacterium]|nr:phenylalanine--tRNA ligase subunit alpha [Deltaproteobacteria bacterium]MBK9369003.1 phenylalanine--tRNA ligase subunit alpha [Deltaproteobacteria bacterium]